MSVDYKNTVFLPKTSFPMRGNLTEKEPSLLKRWEETNLFQQMARVREGSPIFTLHDGPPYANGHIHVGHGFNKILKDVINRTKHMSGYQVRFTPGWDCHGLPIEWKIEEKYREQGLNKEDVPLLQFRQECRTFAESWIHVQRDEFKRLGIYADWNKPYVTMDYQAEAQIVEELGRFLMSGRLYKGERPVMWSVVEKTALAEAEIEYKDVISPSIYVKFKIISCLNPVLQDASAVIWTTTPWTIPANRAIAYGPEIDYVIIQVQSVSEDALAHVDEKLLIAESLLDGFVQANAILSYDVVGHLKGEVLKGACAAHPWRGQGYEFDVPFLPGDHVTTETGTGLVHTAPGHGEEDFKVGRQFGLEVPRTVADDGHYYEHVPLFAGKHVYQVAPEVCATLKEAGALLSQTEYKHSYPHSWRSKAPLIYRVTPQWFISMEHHGLRDRMLSEIEKVTWYPQASKRRIQSMVADCPDWCISRQRAWGTPITIFLNRETGEPLRDPAVMQRIVEAIRTEGGDVWFKADPQRFLGDEYDAKDYEQVQDILDVWFDAGCTHSFVLEGNPDQHWPADLYLEGSDQHRGWFQASLKVACGTRDAAPYKAVLTHGFTLDEQGRKMSKSLGNIVAPAKIADSMGAEIMRLWVVSCDYGQDLRVGPELLKRQQDVYRRLRNTLRYLLGGLEGFQESEKVSYDEMPEFERWILHRLRMLDQHIQQCIESYELQSLYTALHTFCAVDLSAYYFDVRKDVLYCDGSDSLRRRAMRTVFHELFDRLTTWLAPVLCFTAEEAWLERYGDEGGSVHLHRFLATPAAWENAALEERYGRILACRRVMTGALEKARADGLIGSSLQAQLKIYDAADHLPEQVEWEDIAIVSQIELCQGEIPSSAFTLSDVPGIGIIVVPAQGEKCERCWKVLPEVGQCKHPNICQRCSDVVDQRL